MSLFRIRTDMQKEECAAPVRTCEYCFQNPLPSRAFQPFMGVCLSCIQCFLHSVVLLPACSLVAQAVSLFQVPDLYGSARLSIDPASSAEVMVHLTHCPFCVPASARRHHVLPGLGLILLQWLSKTFRLTQAVRFLPRPLPWLLGLFAWCSLTHANRVSSEESAWFFFLAPE